MGVFREIESAKKSGMVLCVGDRVIDNNNDIYMLCQVMAHTFALIGLVCGNRLEEPVYCHEGNTDGMYLSDILEGDYFSREILRKFKKVKL